MGENLIVYPLLYMYALVWFHPKVSLTWMVHINWWDVFDQVIDRIVIKKDVMLWPKRLLTVAFKPDPYLK